MNAAAAGADRRPVTVKTLLEAKREKRPITMLTAYDVEGARLADAAGVDSILVGDSLGMVVLGHDSTLPVTVDDMVRHSAAAARGAKTALVVADMPFLSVHRTVEYAVEAAGRLMVEGGAGAVKIEGGSPFVLEIVSRLVDAGIPVMGHVGLTPQSVHAFGGFSVQGKDVSGAARIFSECLALQEAGAFAVVLELVPTSLAKAISERLAIPTIGIGAGIGCDGQVQVMHDVLGLGTFVPRHAKRYAEVADVVAGALSAYVNEVREGTFPTDAQSSDIDPSVVREAIWQVEGA